MPDTVRQVNCCETCCKDSVTIFLCPTIVCAQTHGPYQHTKCFRKFEAYSDFSDSFSRKSTEQARCATLHSATGCARAHRCELTPEAYLRTTRVCAAMSPRRCRLAEAITA